MKAFKKYNSFDFMIRKATDGHYSEDKRYAVRLHLEERQAIRLGFNDLFRKLRKVYGKKLKRSQAIDMCLNSQRKDERETVEKYLML